VLRSILPLLLLSLLPTLALAAPEGRHFRILQVNDVYKIEGLERGAVGGMARLRGLRRQLAEDGTPVLLLHAGDMLFPSVMSKFSQGESMIAAMNLLDGDPEAADPLLVATFGNHEFDAADEAVVLARLAQSRFQWVSSNAYHCQAAQCERFPGVPETLLLEIGGVRVGLMGLLYPLERPAYVRSTPVIPAARVALAKLRAEGAELVIALTHQGKAMDEVLAQAVPGIDLIIGGHDHRYFRQRVGTTWITKADADIASAIVYDVVLPVGGPLSTVPLRIRVDDHIPADPQMAALVAEWLAALRRAGLDSEQVVGQTAVMLEGVEPVVRGQESALGNLLADAARQAMGTDIAFINGGAIRINDNIPPGPITQGDLDGVFYYDNRLVSFPITGRQLLQLLNHSVAEADSGAGHFLQVSGVRFSYGREGAGFRVAEVTVAGRPLDLSATYSATTVDYVYENGLHEGYTLFAPATRPGPLSSERPNLRQVVEGYLQALPGGRLTGGLDGRIQRRAE